MTHYKIPFQIVLAVALLTIGTLACARVQSDDKAEVEPDVQADAGISATPSDTSGYADETPHLAEPSAADWMTQLQVKMALLEELGSDSLHVGVVSREGEVVLSGSVEKRETKELAETIARSVTAVTDVSNDIRLDIGVDKPNKAGAVAREAEAELKDAMLATKVRLALVEGLGSEGFRIGTKVADGVVTLEFAPELAAAQQDAATEAAESVEGVTKVISVDKT